MDKSTIKKLDSITSHPSTPRMTRRSPARFSSRDLKNVKCAQTDNKRSENTVNRLRKSFKSFFSKEDTNQSYVFVTIGVSTDTAKKKVYPSLWSLFKQGLLPSNIRFYAFSRASGNKHDLREQLQEYMHVKPHEEPKYEEFWKLNNSYVGCYLSRTDFESLHRELMHSDTSNVVTNRLYYMAIPNAFMESVAQNLRSLTQARAGWTRLMTEKPFGKDALTSSKVMQSVLSLCSEEDLFRIDPFLCKDIVQNILTVRFCNLLFSSTWNRKMIETVEIVIKDNTITRKGRYAESYGIICDVLLLQGLQLLALVAMEKPISMKPDDVLDEKVKLLKCIAPVTLENVVIGQYVEHPNTPCSKDSKSSYSFNEEPDQNSNLPTFCTTVVQIHNERWDGVPFIIRCGKGLDEQRSEIRIRYQNVPADIFKAKVKRNELVIRIEPVEGLYIRAVTKVDPYSKCDPKVQETEIPLNFEDVSQSSYDTVLRNVLDGTQTYFIRLAEMKQAWRIFTPLLTNIEKDEIEPIKYTQGTSGPSESERLIRKYVSNEEMWSLSRSSPT